MIIGIFFQALLNIPHREAHFDCVIYYFVIDLYVIIVEGAVSILSYPLPGGVCGVSGRDEVVHLDVTLPDLFFFYGLFIFLGLSFLFVGVLVVHSIVKVLIVELLVVSVQFTNAMMEPDHDVFVHH